MKYQESVTFSTARKVYSQNGVPFVYSEAGETYASIAASNGLFLKELLKFNDHEQELALEPGTMV